MEKATVSKAEDRSYRNCFDLGITGKKSTILDMSVTKMPMAAKMMKSVYALEIEMKKGVIGGEIPSEFVSFGIKELQKLYIEYMHKKKIDAAADDDAKDCVREYYLRQLSSNKLYISLFGLLLSVVALL